MKESFSYLPDELMKFAFTPHNASELKVIGVGGGGCNAVDFMIRKGVQDVQFINCNTDSQALSKSPASIKIRLGETLTRGRGAGANPEVGRSAAIESLPEILDIVRNTTDMVFVTAGMGGGTGTGAAPVIASSIKELGILTVGIVTMPFITEKSERLEYAKDGLKKMKESVDALIVIENDKINDNYGDLVMSEAFTKANEVLANAAQGIVEIIKIHGEWNVDFNDVKTVMTNSNLALMGTGFARGEDRAVEAAKNALESKLLNSSDISGAKKILLNIISGEDEIRLKEHQAICNYVQNASGHASDQFIIGVARDLELGDQVKVTVIATGFNPSFLLKDQPKVDKLEVQSPEKEKVEEIIHKKEKKQGKKKGTLGLQKLIDFFDDEN